MSQDTLVLREYFSKLGLEPEIAELYLALHTYGPQSISELSRRSKVERTRIYRLIDVLAEANLIEVETHYKRSILRAAPVSNLQILLSKKSDAGHNRKSGYSVRKHAKPHQQHLL